MMTTKLKGRCTRCSVPLFGRTDHPDGDGFVCGDCWDDLAAAMSWARARTPASPLANDPHQVGGTHYAAMAIQPWDAMAAWMSREQMHGFLRGNVIKYLARCDAKGGVEDLRKARHYLDRLIAECEREGAR